MTPEDPEEPIDPAQRAVLLRDYMARVLAEEREEIERADNKSAIVFAAISIVSGALVAATIERRWTPHQLGAVPEVIFWVGLGLQAMGIGFAGGALYPRTAEKGQRPPLAYFGDIASFESKSAFEEFVRTLEPQPLERSVDQVWEIGRIVLRKYQFIRYSILCSGAGVSLGALALVVQSLVD